MNVNLFNYNFPNNLKIARRKVNNDYMIIKINTDLQKIEKVKNNQNKYLKRYLESSIRIG
ncbi:MAG: hypothetical protein IKC22_02115 [Bacilli bacterium]|nr:hypothetical protein [Bacilli bacterium]